MNGIQRALQAGLLTAVLTIFAAGPGAAQEKASRIVEPKNGASVPRGFMVKMQVTGLKVEPAGMINAGAGHLHILVDADYLVPGVAIPFDTAHLHYGKGQLEATLNLEPGKHTLRLQFADGAHVALDGPEFRDEITVNVTNEPGIPPPPSAGGMSMAATGESQYTALCAGCHGDDGNGLGVFPSVKRDLGGRPALVTKIDTSMPPGGGCTGQCAMDVADFILAKFGQTKDGGNGTAGGNGKGRPLDNASGVGFTAPTKANCSAPVPAPRSLRLLTRREFDSTTKELLGAVTPLSINQPVPTRVLGYDNNLDVNVVTTRHLESYLASASDLADKAVREQRSRILSCDPNADRQGCTNRFVSELGFKAFRRPLTQEEQGSFVQLLGGAGSFDDGMKLVIRAMLVSPSFLYRSELGEAKNGVFELTPFEVATAMSYLFWGSMPDAQLFDAARNNQLATPDQRLQQAQRMLRDARARTQLGVFAGQWLAADPEDSGEKDPKVYPAYTRAVQEASDAELVRFVNNVVFESSGKFPELYKADYVFANQELARFYGIQNVNGQDLQKVPVADGSRGGVLGLASVLASQAHSDDSSPIKRGVFVRKRLLCHDLPPPPPSVNNAPPGLDPKLTTRARFAAHDADAFCQSCHQFIDKIGFGLERYDGAGGIRTTDAGAPVDDSGELISPSNFDPLNLKNGQSGVPFNGLRGLSNLVADSPDSSRCLTTQFFRHTEGRPETAEDLCAINDLFAQFKASEFDLKTLLVSIVKSPVFNQRREVAR